jgi:hypothetical protein
VGRDGGLQRRWVEGLEVWRVAATGHAGGWRRRAVEAWGVAAIGNTGGSMSIRGAVEAWGMAAGDDAGGWRQWR